MDKLLQEIADVKKSLQDEWVADTASLNSIEVSGRPLELFDVFFFETSKYITDMAQAMHESPKNVGRLHKALERIMLYSQQVREGMKQIKQEVDTFSNRLQDYFQLGKMETYISIFCLGSSMRDFYVLLGKMETDVSVLVSRKGLSGIVDGHAQLEVWRRCSKISSLRLESPENVGRLRNALHEIRHNRAKLSRLRNNNRRRRVLASNERFETDQAGICHYQEPTSRLFSGPVFCDVLGKLGSSAPDFMCR
ncbi:hypothetical protein ACFE04_014635 [Oxalis oulophora]